MARVRPASVGRAAASFTAWALVEAADREVNSGLVERRFMVERHLRRVSRGALSGPELERAVRATFRSYARYYAESFRLPDRTPAEIDDGHDVTGYEHVLEARRAGRGAILALPHLGGWEWSAFWLTRVLGVPVTAVVEPLEPPELFEWFVSFRRSLGMTIVPLGPHAAREVLAALRRNEIVCLLADRDLAGTGIHVELFGEGTTLPAGPATLALRSGAPLLPTAVYSKPRDGVSGVVRPALDTSRTEEGLRRDVVRATQQLATTFEAFIAAAPEQWHLMQPNWPSDHEALAAFRASRAEAAAAARRGMPRRAAGRRPWRRETSPDRGPRGS